MRGFSLSCDFFLLGGINFFGSLILLLLFSLVPVGLWETTNAVWQFLFLLFFLGLLFDIVPAFFARIRSKHPRLTVAFESFGWIPYVYIVAFTTLAGLDILGQFRMQFTPVGMWLTVIVPVAISLVILYGTAKGSPVKARPVFAEQKVATVKVAKKKKATKKKKTASAKVKAEVVSEKKVAPKKAKKAKKAKLAKKVKAVKVAKAKVKPAPKKTAKKVAVKKAPKKGVAKKAIKKATPKKAVKKAVAKKK